MAPEQCVESAIVDAKADVYMLGVTLYEMVCGQRPFMAEHVVEVMTQHVRNAPRPVRALAPEVPTGLAALIHAMLLKDPTERPTMVEVAERLERLERLAGQTITSAGSTNRDSLSRTPLTSALSMPSLVTGVFAPLRVRSLGFGRAMLGLGAVLFVAALTGTAWWRSREHRTDHEGLSSALPISPSSSLPKKEFPPPVRPVAQTDPQREVDPPPPASTRSKQSLDRKSTGSSPKDQASTLPPHKLRFEDLTPMGREE